jgi:hypothetical protein
MRFNCGEGPLKRRQRKIDKYGVWHSWFAWYPVRLGLNDCVWLERIERKANFYAWITKSVAEITSWDYREIESGLS